MTFDEIEQIAHEIETTFVSRQFGKAFQLSRTSVAIDFNPHAGAYLFIDIDPKIRKVYLIRRRLKVLERMAIHSSPFVIALQKSLAGKRLVLVREGTSAEAIHLKFGENGGIDERSLTVLLGVREANVILSECNKRATCIRGNLQSALECSAEIEWTAPRRFSNESLSDVFDAEAQQLNGEVQFDRYVLAARSQLRNSRSKHLKLIANLEADLERHGDAQRWKRLGDLILANLATLRHVGNSLIVTDFFDTQMPEVTIEIGKNQTPTEAAEAYFRRYSRARNGAEAIATRLQATLDKIETLRVEQARLETAIEARDEAAVLEFVPALKQPVPGKKEKTRDDFKGARRFVSTDGFEILVGKQSRDNDFLTFRIAKSLDLWLHAADYPGSHVVVRNPTRNQLPTRTLIEAAEIAAFYSDARDIPKAAVNYTAKKYVNKPKRASPGLVSLSAFKTILVEPKIGSTIRKG